MTLLTAIEKFSRQEENSRNDKIQTIFSEKKNQKQ